MDDSLFMSVFECVDELLDDWTCFGSRQRTLRDSLVEGRALDQFHDERRILYAMDRGDVWVIERRQNLRLS